jgi:hypothetical protein
MLKLNIELDENEDNNCFLRNSLESFEKEEEFEKKCDKRECEFYDRITKAKSRY